MMESNAGNQNMEEDIVELLTKIDHRLSVIEGRTDKIESIDRKLSELTSKVTSIEKEVDNVKKRTNTLEKDAGEFKKELTETKRDINEMKDACNAANKVNVSDLREKIIDLQCRSMQNNLVFSGIEEKPEEDTKIVIQNFISNELSIKKDIQFGNIHRFGRADKNKGKPRLIVAKFVYFADLRKVLEAGPKLKEKPQYTGVYIVNGRIGDNITGKLTSKNAASVDYVLATPDLLNIISNSDVLHFSNLFSDAHCECPFDISINIKTTTCTCNACNPRTDIQPKKEQIKKWNLAKADEFNEYLDLAKIETIDNALDLLTDDHVNMNNINDTVKNIDDIFVDAAKHTFGTYNPKNLIKEPTMRKKRNRINHGLTTSAGKKEKNTRRTQRLYRLCKSEENKRIKNQKSKEYKKTLNKCIKKYRIEMRNKMKNMKTKNPKEYWKLLNGEHKQKQKQPNIPIQILYDFFNELNETTSNDENGNTQQNEHHDTNQTYEVVKNTKFSSISSSKVEVQNFKLCAISCLSNGNCCAASFLESVGECYLVDNDHCYDPTNAENGWLVLRIKLCKQR
ncbi:unnamed protein product [Mytilus edulis]|uniref:Apple domain-containing protein n=1 Tax=Mytilus edulis TaxID=6550 RepID=A0A8S3U0B2_MYTED|nr:unnamed protein product [Mytilus edulis]